MMIPQAIQSHEPLEIALDPFEITEAGGVIYIMELADRQIIGGTREEIRRLIDRLNALLGRA